MRFQEAYARICIKEVQVGAMEAKKQRKISAISMQEVNIL